MTLQQCIDLYELAQTRIRFVRPVVTPLGYAAVDAIRAERHQQRPLTREELERIAEEHGIRINDLWPLLADEPADEPAAA